MQQRIDPSDTVDTSGFVTLHDLARDCDVRQKNIWYRLKKLIQRGRLEPGVHYFTHDYVDQFHFEWKLDPRKYLELSPKHRERFSERQRRIQFESEVAAELIPPARNVESEDAPTSDPAEPEVESRASFQLESDPVLAKLLEQVDRQSDTIVDLQKTIRTISGDFSTFSKVMVNLSEENRKYQEQIFQLAPPSESRSQLTAPEPASSHETTS